MVPGPGGGVGGEWPGPALRPAGALTGHRDRTEFGPVREEEPRGMLWETRSSAPGRGFGGQLLPVIQATRQARGRNQIRTITAPTGWRRGRPPQ
ncbi:hypothetical protein GCM10010406_40290 [Streptomyces thermolineatus]|uniref:Uncharacterized protein n=1 Tax=Streptomyces thermolineatus TaxID=44033 RepID=A0ABP5ZJ73_9ACTN